MPGRRGSKPKKLVSSQESEKTKAAKKKKDEPIIFSSEEEEEYQEEEEEYEVQGKNCMEEIKTILKKFKQEIREELREFEKSLSFNCKKMDDVLSKMNQMQNTMNQISTKQKKLEEENEQLKSKIKEMERAEDDLEQYTRNKNIQIDGVPQQDNENLEEMMKVIGEKIDVPIKNEDIDAIHRIPTRSPSNPEPIIVQFLTRKKRDAIIQKAKPAKLTTKDLNMTCNEKSIFINEHLTKKRKQIMYEARKLKNEKSYKFLWTKGCKIFIRKDERSNSIQLNCMEDLKKIK